jgi:hypothetical protein
MKPERVPGDIFDATWDDPDAVPGPNILNQRSGKQFDNLIFGPGKFNDDFPLEGQTRDRPGRGVTGRVKTRR